MVLVPYRSMSVFSLGGWTPHLPAGLACPAVLYAAYHRSSTGLSPSVVGLPMPFDSVFVLLRAAPLSLATTRGIVSFPRTTWMFRFVRCPLPCLCVQQGVRDHAVTRVSPFGYLRFIRLHTPRRSFSQCTASFFGTQRQVIPPVPL